MNRRKSMRNTRHKNTNNPQKKYRLGLVSKNISLEGLNRFHSANLTLILDVDQDTKMFGLHEIPLAYQCIISKKGDKAKIRTQQYIKLNTRAKTFPTGRPWWA